MVEKIYEYREKASTPMELRDTAMVMLGLRMGIRGADILKLQVNDFDWKNKTVSFIQQKTSKAITLNLQRMYFEIIKLTYDLHSETDWEDIQTEHEKMFSEKGIKIKALIARLTKK